MLNFYGARLYIFRPYSLRTGELFCDSKMLARGTFKTLFFLGGKGVFWGGVTKKKRQEKRSGIFYE